MSESHQNGLDNLGQRLQAMADPALGDRSRTYASAPSLPGSQGQSRVPGGPTAGSGTGLGTGQGIGHGTGYESSPFRVPPPPQEPAMHEHEHVPQFPQAQQAAGSAPSAGHNTGHSSGFGDDAEPRNGLQRAISAVKAALPFVQKLLPLLDGNVVTAVTALLAPVMQHTPPRPAPPPPPQVKVDLEPIERSLADLRNGQREFRNQLADQVNSMKRVEDQLERVREATDRNTLEQQEMVEDLRAVGNRVSTLAVIGVILLALSLGLNIYLLIQMQHLLR